MHTAQASHSFYNGTQGWSTPQPTSLNTTAEYIELAHEMRPAYADWFNTFASKLGPGVQVIAPEIKGQKSAERKLWDRTSRFIGQPDMIGDYLRARIYVPVREGAIAQFHHATQALFDDSTTVGRKDSVTTPNPATAWRAVYGLQNIDDKIIAETQIVPLHPVVQKGSEITESLRSAERAIRQFEESYGEFKGAPSDRRGVKLIYQAEDTIRDIRGIRKAVHDFAFAAAGMNSFLDSGLVKHHKPVTCEKLVQILDDASSKYFGGRMLPRFMPQVREMIALTH